MALKMDTHMTHHVDSYDLMDFVFETYGVQFNFVADMECGNDSSHSFTVTGEVMDQDDIDRFLQGEHVSYISWDLLNYMAKTGLIPNGNYIISVCW